MKKNPLFTAAIALCAVLALGELFLIYERFMASREAAKTLVARKGELQSMADLNPPPKREVAATIEADLAKAQASLASMQAELKGRGPAAERLRSAKLPANRTDAYFDLATFVEKTRELAKKHEVVLRPEASRFGFAAYANEGPAADHIEPVFRQRQIAQYLVEALLEAKPRALLLAKREPTLGKEAREARAAANAAAAAGQPAEPPPAADASAAGADGPDYFTIDPRVSARQAGFIDTVAFRFAFTGQTAALRLFLNKLASFELPVLVREVEVEAASGEDAVVEDVAAAAAAAEAAGNEPPAASVVLSAVPPAPKATTKAPVRPAVRTSAIAPIVAKPLSKYTVTVEFVELVTPPPPPAADAAPAPAPPSS